MVQQQAVRRAVAQNAQTPAEVLTKLAEDADAAVRRAVAQNAQTPAEIRARLNGEAPVERASVESSASSTDNEGELTAGEGAPY